MTESTKATSENTVFLTVSAFDDFEEQTTAFRETARRHAIPVVFCDEGERWQGFLYHKVERMSLYLKSFAETGKQYAFILDSRDVIFIENLESVLKKFNSIDEGKVIFNHDMPGAVWPTLKDYVQQAMEAAMNSEHARLNAGMIAGKIDTLLAVQNIAMALHSELVSGWPRDGIAKRLYQDIGVQFSDDDQYLYQICMVYYPELFQIDYAKDLFAVLMSYPQDLQEYSDDPRRHDVINSAAIIHSPWLSREPEWNERAIQNRWK